jgi:hypothetical protein
MRINSYLNAAYILAAQKLISRLKRHHDSTTTPHQQPSVQPTQLVSKSCQLLTAILGVFHAP